MREDFSVLLGLCNHALHAAQIVRVMHGSAIHNRVGAMRVVVDAHQVRLRSGHMQPGREEHVDLVHVLAERGVAGLVVGHIVGRAQAFAGVEGDVGGFARGFAPRRMQRLVGARGVGVAHRLVIVFWRRGQQLWQRPGAQHIEDEGGHHQRDKNRGDIEDAA